jgi:hypothetical protein
MDFIVLNELGLPAIFGMAVPNADILDGEIEAGEREG